MVLAALALASGVAAVTLVPARILLDETKRAGPVPRAVAESCSLHPVRILEFVAPGALGDPEGEYPARSLVGEPGLDGGFLSNSLYMGAAVVALALVALGRGRRLALALAATVAVALAIALGRHLPVHAVFRTLVFPLSNLRSPEKYTVLVVAGLALLAGLGADRIAAGERPWRRTGVLLGLLAALGLCAGLLFPPTWAAHVRPAAGHAVVAVAVVLAVMALARRCARLALPLLLALVAIDLALPLWSVQPLVARQVATTRPLAARVILHQHPDGAAPPRVYRPDQVSSSVAGRMPADGAADRVLALLRTMVANTAQTFGVATLPGYDAAIPRALGQVWDAISKHGQAALRLFSAGHVILPFEPERPGPAPPGLLPVMDPLPGARLYRVARPLPRVYLAGHAEVLPDVAALPRLLEPAVLDGGSVWLAPQLAAASLDGPAAPAGRCEIESFRNTAVRARCRADRPAVAVFVEQFADGWSARVNGVPAPLLRANHVMRAVMVGPGNHTIELSYRTPGLRAGAALSLVGLAALLALAVASAAGARRRRFALQAPAAAHVQAGAGDVGSIVGQQEERGRGDIAE
jgi:hypothetical protein